MSKLAAVVCKYISTTCGETKVKILPGGPMDPREALSTDEPKGAAAMKGGNKPSHRRDFLFGIGSCFAEGKIPPFSKNFSGGYGQGIATLIHKTYEKVCVKGYTQHLRGNPMTLSAVMQGTAWKEVPASYRRIWRLVEYGATHIRCGEILTWMKPLEAMKGDIVRKKLKAETLALLTPEESSWLKAHFKEQWKAWEQFNADLTSPTEQFLLGFKTSLEQVLRSVHGLESAADRTSAVRAEALARHTRASRGKTKIRLQSRLDQLSLGVYSKYWSPLQLVGKHGYVVDETQLVTAQGAPVPNGIDIIRREYASFIDGQTGSKLIDPSLGALAKGWYNSTLEPKIKEACGLA